MRNDNIPEMGIHLKGLPVYLTKLFNELLDENDFSKKHNARTTLVRIGKRIIPHLHKLLTSKNELLRMEAAKILELIADKRTIPKFILLLDDEEFDIRWIAGEGLIKIGRQSIIPLLKSIRDGKSSYFHNKASHHVLVSLLSKDEKENLNSFLESLDDFHELGEISPTEASRALKVVFKSKS
jgi:HEAT repeat protein